MRSSWIGSIHATPPSCGPGTRLILETGSSTLGVMPMPLADGVRVEAQVLWGSIGWATPTPSAFALADPGADALSSLPGKGPTIDGERNRQHGQARRQYHHLVLNNEGLSDRAGLGGKSGLGLAPTSRLGDMRNCRARSDAPIGSPHAYRRLASSTPR